MADLRDVAKRIDELKAQIAPLQRELEVLENAARVLRGSGWWLSHCSAANGR